MIPIQTCSVVRIVHKFIVCLFTFTLCVFNSGCGGGGGGLTILSGVGSGGTGAAAGTISGFGSVIIDGQRIDDESALLAVESEPGSPNRLGIDEVETKLGQQTLITADATISSASSIQINPAVIGLVESINSSSSKIVVAGQDVVFNTTTTHGAPTVLDGYEQLSDIAPGDQVLVHGHLQYVSSTSTQIQASRIELQPPSVAPEVRVTGLVSNYNSTAMRFNIGALLVNYNSSTIMLPNGMTLSNGQKVVVWSTSTVSNGQLQAQIISTSVDSIAGLTVKIGGLISGCGITTACTGTFKVDGVIVDPSSAVITVGSGAQLTDGQYASVAGTADSQTGIVKATAVALRATNEIDTILYGAIFDPVGTTTFLIHGVPVMITANTVISSGCSVAEGQAVQVTASISGSRVTAQNINCLQSLEGLTVDLRGIISGLSANSFHLSNTLDSLPVNFSKATFIDGSSSSLSPGGYVVVRGKVKNGTLVAKTVRIAPVPSQFETEGIAYAVGAASFKIHGLSINYTANSVAGGSTLRSGHRIRVQFTGNNNVFQALSIKIL